MPDKRPSRDGSQIWSAINATRHHSDLPRLRSHAGRTHADPVLRLFSRLPKLPVPAAAETRRPQHIRLLWRRAAPASPGSRVAAQATDSAPETVRPGRTRLSAAIDRRRGRARVNPCRSHRATCRIACRRSPADSSATALPAAHRSVKKPGDCCEFRVHGDVPCQPIRADARQASGTEAACVASNYNARSTPIPWRADGDR